jgi:dGTPase
MILAPYASSPEKSKGRVYDEATSNLRNVFQRDRDRIIHSSSFRRLQYKTQVFVNHEGDMFRSRLTHSIEVSQIARGISRTLKCHEDLAEGIALAHDLGHTPFGHAGQDALNKCMRDHGGFEHNFQSLRTVDMLEKRYADFDGLNLTFETREGILKHCSLKNARKLGELGERFINGFQPSIEAQIVNLSDEIAYSHHDLDDGFRSGILNIELLSQIKLFDSLGKEIKKTKKKLADDQYVNEVLRKMMNLIIFDLCENSKNNIIQYNPLSPNDVRHLKPLVQFSNGMNEQMNQIKSFSKTYLYNHPRIRSMTIQAQAIVCKLFDHFKKNFENIPEAYKSHLKSSKERIIADYIAGMTDRFANHLYSQI